MSARGKIFHTLYKWHRWLGLFLALHLFVLILTGTLLVFQEEWQSFGIDSRQLAQNRDPGSRLSLQDLLDLARKADPSGVPLAINFDDEDPEQLTIRMGKDGSTLFRGSSRQHFDRYQGPQESIVRESGFWDFVLRLHRDFLLGFYGKLYVGLIGMLFILALLSGLAIYGPITARLTFGSIRLGRSSWTWSDVHKLVGAGSFGWLALIAITGTLLATSGQLLKLYQYTELKDLKATYPNAMNSEYVSLDIAEASVAAEKPESETAFITFPGTEFSTAGHFIFVVNEREGWRRFLNEIVLVDGTSGKIVSQRGLPWYLKAAILSEPLHFGNYGGIALKLVWTAFGFLGLALSLSGPYLWYKKRRKTDFIPTASIRKKPERSRRGAYFIPSCLGLATLLGSLLAMTNYWWLDAFSIGVLTLTLLYVLKKLVSGLSPRSQETPAKDL